MGSYFEDVAVGDKLPTMAKGPMTVTGFIAFTQGWGALHSRQQAELEADQPSRRRRHTPDCPESVHWDPDMAALNQ